MDNCKYCKTKQKNINKINNIFIILSGWLLGTMTIISGTILFSIKYNQYSDTIGLFTILCGVYTIASYTVLVKNKRV